MLLKKSVQSVFCQLSGALQQLSSNEYSMPSQVLNNATIGQHVRHIIELFQCLLNGYETGFVNYDKRKRDVRIEADKYFAAELLEDILQHLERDNRRLKLQAFYDEEQAELLCVETNFHREVVYNLEHAIHHMALIRIGVEEVSDIRLGQSFGVAPSTIQYRNACAQ